jgi:hypothetical protein
MRQFLLAFLVAAVSACGGAGSLGVSRLTDSGVRCVRAPCPSILVSPLGPGEPVRVSEIEYPPSMSREERDAAALRRFQPGGLLARGTLYGRDDEGLFVLESVLEHAP